MRHLCQKFLTHFSRQTRNSLCVITPSPSVNFRETGAQPRSTQWSLLLGIFSNTVPSICPPPPVLPTPSSLGPGAQGADLSLMHCALVLWLLGGFGQRETQETGGWDERSGHDPLHSLPARPTLAVAASSLKPRVRARSLSACADLLSLPAPAGGKTWPLGPSRAALPTRLVQPHHYVPVGLLCD